MQSEGAVTNSVLSVAEPSGDRLEALRGVTDVWLWAPVNSRPTWQWTVTTRCKVRTEEVLRSNRGPGL